MDSLKMDATHQPDSPLWLDPAEHILRADAGLTDDQRERLWEIFHDSPTPEALARVLQYHDVSNDTKHQLFEAKRRTAPAETATDRTVSALKRVASIDPKILETAEKHPTVLKALSDAAHVGTNHKTKSK
jgi:hypothetical protein